MIHGYNLTIPLLAWYLDWDLGSGLVLAQQLSFQNHSAHTLAQHFPPSQIPIPPPLSAHCAHGVIVDGTETDCRDLTTYVTSIVEDKNKYIGIKIRYFGV